MENGRSLQRVQEEVDEVTVIMMDNINKAKERSGKLDELEDRADELKKQGENFVKTSEKVKRKKQWEAHRLKILFAVIISVVILVIIIVAVIMYYSY
ncbi:vesicle-associated membrane protein 5 [Denticeps clupeoides]|uniref:V-SNARE coiled-coil homology domain-containing protein n=1 Tax=Denticeps clupeoides TaxID=299321 RepID=A0AAY4B2F7_9TELE|nr:vesicle-associated membrane protein 5-like [Denticeps clupeoides]